MKDRKETAQRQKSKVSRRDFMGGAAAAAMAFTIVPQHALGRRGNRPPSGKLNIACAGVGGMGKNNLRACQGENIVALCDVDHDYSAAPFKEYPNARVYRDYRKMLDRQKDIDAVTVASEMSNVNFVVKEIVKKVLIFLHLE